jgi:uncharacterized protein (DUF697 family)
VTILAVHCRQLNKPCGTIIKRSLNMKKAKTEEEVTAEIPDETIAAPEGRAAEIPDETIAAAEGRADRLDKIAKNHILAAMGVGLIPIPLVDVAALMGVQIGMIRKLAAEYEVPFKQDKGKSIVTSLMGGLLSTELGMTLACLVKCIPVIGQTTGAVAMPVISGAATYAVYKVFVKHFESGGTLLDLDPAKVKSYFTEQFSKGKKIVTDLGKETPPDTSA